MKDDASEFGPFGSGMQPTVERARTGRRRSYILIGILLLILPAALFGWTDIYLNFLERERPKITIIKVPVGVGIEPIKIVANIDEFGAGLDNVIVRIEQAGEFRELLHKRYSESNLTHDAITIEISGEESGLKEGEASLMISAADKSFWKNAVQTTVYLKVDYTPPAVALLTPEHRAELGGSSVQFYSVLDGEDTFSGITIGPYLFPGFPAYKLDNEFRARPSVAFALFPIPTELEGDESIRLFARDAVGNIATTPLRFSFGPVDEIERHDIDSGKLVTPRAKAGRQARGSQGSSNYATQLDEKFMRERVEQLYRDYLQLRARVEVRAPEQVSDALTDDELMRRFRVVDEEYREFSLQRISGLFSRPKADRLWSGQFLSFSGGKRIFSYGDRVSYFYQGVELGSRAALGTAWTVSRHVDVRASNSGIVIFADDLGPLGKTVIIDHGFGLTSLYAHLLSISCTEGDRIDKRQPIGKLGSSGLVPENTLYFEIRLHGVPVNPIEWGDRDWLSYRFEKVVARAKLIAGIKPELSRASSALDK